MRTLFIATGIIIFVGLAPAQAASFNCGKANLNAEVAICNTPNLSDLDGQIADRYFEIYNRSSKWEQRRLKREQKSWLRQRNSCGYEIYCLEQTMTERRDTLFSFGD